MKEVAAGLKSDLAKSKDQAHILESVRSALVNSHGKNLTQQNTKERASKAQLMPKQEADSIMEKLITKLV
jgi:hypothetical protein